MSTHQKYYFPQLDSLRFFAILLVMFAHWMHDFPIVNSIRLGAFAVDLFFVISGFLITLQLLNLKQAIDEGQFSIFMGFKRFFWRRILRIFPLYFTVLILTTLFNKGEIRDAFFWNASFLSNFYMIKMQIWPSTFSHFWSLSVEEHFYLFLPFIVFFSKEKLSLCLILFSIAFRFFVLNYQHDFFKVYAHTFSCLDVFLIGSLLAYFYKIKVYFFKFLTANLIFKTSLFILFCTSFVLLVLKPVYLNFNWVFLRTIAAIFFALIVAFLVSEKKHLFFSLMNLKAFIFLGKLSYGMYLIHNFVPGILLGIKKFNLPNYLEFIIYFSLTLLISIVLHFGIERPVLKLRSLWNNASVK
jgi:peptidoglycan/LPS O-acetylase OafA/YrhL